MVSFFNPVCYVGILQTMVIPMVWKNTWC